MIKDIRDRLNHAAHGIRSPKLSFTKLYLASKEKLDDKYPAPKRTDKDPDGFRYYCNNPYKTPIENLGNDDV